MIRDDETRCDENNNASEDNHEQNLATLAHLNIEILRAEDRIRDPNNNVHIDIPEADPNFPNFPNENKKS